MTHEIAKLWFVSKNDETNTNTWIKKTRLNWLTVVGFADQAQSFWAEHTADLIQGFWEVWD